MIEVEVKARTLPDTLDKIISLGATFSGTESHEDLYFNHPQRDFRRSDEALRIRIKEEGARLTYKGPKLDGLTKSRKELTVKIDSPQEMAEILAALGFVLSAVVRKRRTKYVLGDITFALDDVEGLGSFLEMEIRGEADFFEEQRRRVLSLLEELGLGESIRSSYLELLDEKARKESAAWKDRPP